MASKFGFTLTASLPISSSCYCSREDSFQLMARRLGFGRNWLTVKPRATADQPGQVEQDEVVDSKIWQYCSIDKKDKKSLGELETEFLQALQAFYYEGKAVMSNEEFDNLKEELMWEGSSVVMLSRFRRAKVFRSINGLCSWKSNNY